MKIKKHLSFSSLRKALSTHFRQLPDNRREESIDYSIHDAMMSGFACMYFQDRSLLQFQKRLQEERHSNNLKTLYDVENIPSNTQLRDITDQQDSQWFTPVAKEYVSRLQRSKQLESFQLFPGKYLCPMDATLYFSSKSIRNKKSLTKNHRDGTITYQHFALQAALMHPDMKQVVPMAAEDIVNIDGHNKQDCETNAGKRLIPVLQATYPKLGLIIGGDDLFSRQPTIEAVLLAGKSYIFVAKPSSHQYMFEWLATYEHLNKRRVETVEGHILYEWMNDVPLYGGENAIQVNYFSQKIFKTDPAGNEKLISENSWVTDMTVTHENVCTMARGGRCRWKIENECFNTLKNQGYYLKHNYGHGDEHLSFNMYLLTVLAFTFHQIFELTDPLYQACRQKFGSKMHMWETLRSYIKILIFDSWELLLRFALDPSEYLPERPRQFPPKEQPS